MQTIFIRCSTKRWRLSLHFLLIRLIYSHKIMRIQLLNKFFISVSQLIKNLGLYWVFLTAWGRNFIINIIAIAITISESIFIPSSKSFMVYCKVSFAFSMACWRVFVKTWRIISRLLASQLLIRRLKTQVRQFFCDSHVSFILWLIDIAFAFNAICWVLNIIIIRVISIGWAWYLITYV